MKMRILALLATASVARAQTHAVIAKAEPHHHLAFEDGTIRVLRVRVGAHDTTLLHQHDADYFWISLGASTIVNAKPGIPDATVTSDDLSIHFTPGKFAHVARNPGTTPFDNITVELLKPQTGVRPLCDAVSSGALDCPATSDRASKVLLGATEHPSFQTNEVRVSLVTIEPGKTLKPGDPKRPAWIIALDTLDARADGKSLAVDSGGRWVGGTFHPSSPAWSLTNHSAHAVRAITVVQTAREH